MSVTPITLTNFPKDSSWPETCTRPMISGRSSGVPASCSAMVTPGSRTSTCRTTRECSSRPATWSSHSDYKGWGESEGPRTRLAPYSRVADVRAALTFLGAQAMVDENRLGIYGTSYGGATVVWTGAVEHLAPSPSLRLSRHFDLFTTDTGGSASAAVCRRTHARTYALHRAFYALKRDAGEPSARDAG